MKNGGERARGSVTSDTNEGHLQFEEGKTGSEMTTLVYGICKEFGNFKLPSSKHNLHLSQNGCTNPTPHVKWEMA